MKGSGSGRLHPDCCHPVATVHVQVDVDVGTVQAVRTRVRVRRYPLQKSGITLDAQRLSRLRREQVFME